MVRLERSCVSGGTEVSARGDIAGSVDGIPSRVRSMVDGDQVEVLYAGEWLEFELGVVLRGPGVAARNAVVTGTQALNQEGAASELRLGIVAGLVTALWTRSRYSDRPMPVQAMISQRADTPGRHETEQRSL